MPRRNENARSRFRPTHESWRISELRAMSDMIDKKTTNRISESLSEQIVRDFRKNEGLELNRPLKPISTIRSYRGIRWWKKVNWIVALEWTCLILAVLAILIISGLILFSPFGFRQVIKWN